MLVKGKLINKLGFVCLLAALVVVAIWNFKRAKPAEPVYDIAKTIRYSFQVTNQSNRFIENPSFSVFAPVKQNAFQKTANINANLPFKLKLDQSGNQTLEFELPGLAPYASHVVSITAEVSLASTPQSYNLNSTLFLDEEPGIETKTPEVIALADALGGQPMEISGWLYRNIKDIGYVAEDRGAQYAVTEKKGDCTEFASAFVALARASDVPARMIGGFMTNNSGRLLAENYHNWAEFKQDDSWAIADPQNNVLDTSYGAYIAFYNFDKYSRLENSQRFLTYDNRLNVQMK
ncbi:transglutaminase-like domain-containing protein [Microbulbifer epialgicus]|uniref:Transglutaminase-like domain-containing protein n=1 Tax=Microbulbifer epialgicus TaxID=393907 RepID=A0ABV4NYV3_9GAMM